MPTRSVQVLLIPDDPALVGAVGRSLMRVQNGTHLRPVVKPVGTCGRLRRTALKHESTGRSVALIIPPAHAIASSEGQEVVEAELGALREECPEVPIILAVRRRGGRESPVIDVDGVIELAVALDNHQDLEAAALLWPTLSNDGLDWFRRGLPASVALPFQYALSVLLDRKCRIKGDRLSEADLARPLCLNAEGLRLEFKRRRIGHFEALGPLLDGLAVAIRMRKQGRPLKSALDAVGYQGDRELVAAVAGVLPPPGDSRTDPGVWEAMVRRALRKGEVKPFMSWLTCALHPSRDHREGVVRVRDSPPRSDEDDSSTRLVSPELRERYREWFRLAYSRARRKRWSREDARDVASHVVGVLVKQLQAEGSEWKCQPGFVCTVAESLMRNRIQRSRTRKAGGSWVASMPGGGAFPADPATMARIEFYESREELSSADRNLSREWNPEVLAALARLTARQRTVLLFSEAFELDRSEVATLMGMSRSAVGSEVHRTKRLLAKALAEMLDTTP